MFFPDYEINSLPALHRAAGQADPGQLLSLLTGELEIDARADSSYSPPDRAKLGLTALMVAARSDQGTVAAVRALLERGADPRAVSTAGAEPIWYAAAAGDPERLALLLAAGGDPQSTTADGRSAVTMAAAAGSPEALGVLLRAGASPHPPGGLAGYLGAEGLSIPLWAAAAAGSAPCVQMLLDLGAPAAARDGRGRTALMYAGTPEAAALLIAAGCPLDAQDDSGRCALRAALDNSQLFTAAAMRAAPHIHDTRQHEPEIRRRQLAVAAALLDAGASPEARDQRGQTPLIGHCQRYDAAPALVELLVARGADIEARDDKGRSALHAAAWNHSAPEGLALIVRALAEAGAAVEARDQAGRTPLHLAVAKPRGDRRVIAVLLDRGADIEARDAAGLTPLMLAGGAETAARAVVGLLLDRGARRDARAADGRSAADILAARVAELERQAAAADPADEPARAAMRAADLRLRARSLRAALEILDPAAGPPAPPAPAALPAPAWLGYEYRAGRRQSSQELWQGALETAHIDEVRTFAHRTYYMDPNPAACFPSEAAAREAHAQHTGQAAGEADLLAYRAYPMLFDSSGQARPLDEAVLIGQGAERPVPPDPGAFVLLGYDVTECDPDQPMHWPGCSPLSPFCNWMASGLPALVNRHCLLDDLAAACDVATLFGVMRPEPGPYLIVEVWRRRPAPPGPDMAPSSDAPGTPLAYTGTR